MKSERETFCNGSAGFVMFRKTTENWKQKFLEIIHIWLGDRVRQQAVKSKRPMTLLLRFLNATAADIFSGLVLALLLSYCSATELLIV